MAGSRSLSDTPGMASPERVREFGLGQNSVDRTPTATRQARSDVPPNLVATSAHTYARRLAASLSRCRAAHAITCCLLRPWHSQRCFEVTEADPRSQLMQARLRGRSCCGLVLVRVRCEPVSCVPRLPRPGPGGLPPAATRSGSPAPRIRPRSLSEWSGHPRPLPPDDVATAHLPTVAAT